MRKVLKVVGILAALIVILIAGAGTYLLTVFPKVGSAPDLSVESTPEMIARGEYIANHVTVCIDCHSARDWRYFSAPPTPGTFGQGGDRFDETVGFPGVFYSRNITPEGIGDWTDGEIARAVSSGVNKTGEALFPVMPYPDYVNLSEQDLHAVIAYVKTLTPIVNQVPERTINFPMNLIVRTIPKPYEPKAHPDTSNKVEYGKYLATISGCRFCHTPSEKGQAIPGMEFAGGYEFMMPNGLVTSANITPDEDTGIGGWDAGAFIAIFRSYAPEQVKSAPLDPKDFNTVMPWSMYAGMTDADLTAIYEYLRTVNPVNHSINRFVPIDEINATQ